MQEEKAENEFDARESYVSESNDNEHNIYGVALSASDVLRSRSRMGMAYLKFSREALMEAAPTLEGQPLVLDHENRSVRDSVGEVTEAKYEDGKLKYKARLVSLDDELLERIKASLFEVSIRAFHRPVSQLEYDGETGQYIINDTEFDNLSIVTKGEAQSNTLNYGDTQLDSADVTASFGDGDVEVIAASISEAEIDETLESERVTSQFASVKKPTYDGTSTGKLNESSIDEDNYETNYIVRASSKSDSAFPVVDGNNTLRKGNVKSAWKKRNEGKGSGEKIGRIAKSLANEWDDLDLEGSQIDDPGEGETAGTGGTDSEDSDEKPESNKTEAGFYVPEEKDVRFL